MELVVVLLVLLLLALMDWAAKRRLVQGHLLDMAMLFWYLGTKILVQYTREQ